MRSIVPAFVFCLLCACAAAPEPPYSGRTVAGEILYSPVERLPRNGGGDAVALLEDVWSNSEQYAFAPDGVELQYAAFHRVDAPAIGPHVVYLEWRSGGPDGAISRQQLWAFREAADGALAGMDVYRLAEPGRHAGRGGETGAVAELTSGDLVAYPDGCTLTARVPAWTGHALETRRRACRITDEAGRRVGLQARVEIARHRVGYGETGIFDDGTEAFGSPGGGQAYEFRRAGE